MMSDLTRLLLWHFGRCCTDPEALRAPAAILLILLTALTALARRIVSASCTAIDILHFSANDVRATIFGAARAHSSSLLLAVGSPDAEQTTNANTADVLFESSTTSMLATGQPSLMLTASITSPSFETTTALVFTQNSLRLQCLVVIACVLSALITLMDRDVSIDALFL